MGNVPPVESRSDTARLRALKPALERLYRRYNAASLVDPDPLAPVLRYADPRDREVAGLIAASLAFGNVKQILRSVDAVFTALPSPQAQVLATDPVEWPRRFADFRHRYVTGAELADLLRGVHSVLRAHGSLGAAFARDVRRRDATILPGLGRWVARLRAGSELPKNYLLSNPAGGSACKRLMMYARWMVRRDAVDLGLWTDVPSSKLVVPIDTHMHRTALALGLTARKIPDLRAALEVTASFKAIAPRDPVKYDFSLTRLGIRADGDLAGFLAGLGGSCGDRDSPRGAVP